LVAALLLAIGCADQRTAPDDDGGSPPAPRSVSFDKRVLDKEFRAEGIAIADIDGDGTRDIVTGSRAYLGPSFASRDLTGQRAYDAATEFSDSFAVFAHDVDADTRTDVIAVGFPLAGATWRRNTPGGSIWPILPFVPVAATESPLFRVLPGRTAPALLYTRDRQLIAATFDAQRNPQEEVLGTAPVPIPPHGLGVGDIDGDGHEDVLTTVGIFRGPSYQFVPTDLGPDCAQMFAFDVDGDGKNDVVSSSAHTKGVFWHRQGEGLSFSRNVIDESFSQSHALVVADLDADGTPELITGKRRWAHGPTGDVDPGAPAVLYWFSLQRGDGGPRWTRHAVDPESDSGVGTQFVVEDVNGDGLLDIATANKEGVLLFTQRR
jgi:FG-GAP-like repeat